MSNEWTAVQRPNQWTATRVPGGARVSQAGYVGPTGATGTGIPSPGDRPTVTGSRASGAALVSLLAALETLELIIDDTTV